MEGTRKNRAPFPRLSLGPGALLNVGASKNLLSSRNVFHLPRSQAKRHQEDGGEVRGNEGTAVKSSLQL